MADKTAWKLTGTYFEACICEAACPCVMMSPPTTGEGFRLFADDAFKAHGPQHLHGALADERGAGMDGSAAVVFNGECPNAVVG